MCRIDGVIPSGPAIVLISEQKPLRSTRHVQSSSTVPRGCAGGPGRSAASTGTGPGPTGRLGAGVEAVGSRGIAGVGLGGGGGIENFS